MRGSKSVVLGGVLLAISVSLLLGSPQNVYAGGAGACSINIGQPFTVTDGAASITWGCDDIFDFSFHDINHVDEVEVHICVESFSDDDFGDCSDTNLDEDLDFSDFTLSGTSPGPVDNTITLVYTASGGDLVLTIFYEVNEISSTEAELSIEYTIGVEDGGNDENIRFFHTTDADVDPTSDGSDSSGAENLIRYNAPLRTITFSEGDVEYKSFSKTPIDFLGICDEDEDGDECQLDGQPTDGHLTLPPGDSVPQSGPGDWESAFEYDFEIAYHDDDFVIEVVESIVLPSENERVIPDFDDMLMFNSGEEGEGSVVDFIIGDGPGNEGPFSVPIEDVCNNVGDDWPITGQAFIVPPILDQTPPDDEFNSGPLEFDWKPKLDITDEAEWLSTDANPRAGDTGLFFHDFEMPNAPIFKAAIVFDFLTDNVLGDLDDTGLLLNCEGIDGAKSDPQIAQKDYFQIDQFMGPFDITESLTPGENTLQIYSRDIFLISGTPAGIQYKATILWDACAPGQELIPIEEEEEVVIDAFEFECIAKKTGGGGPHEPPTIGKSLDGRRQVVENGICIDGDCWTVEKPYHQEFELLQMLTSPHTISNTIYCAHGVNTCNYIAVGFMPITGDFTDPTMVVSASRSFQSPWEISVSDPGDYIYDPSDAVPEDITFTTQEIEDKLLGTSFTINFKNKDTGQLKLGIQVRDDKGGVRNHYFNEGVMFMDADAYPIVEASYDKALKLEKLCIGADPDYRNSCSFAKKKSEIVTSAEDIVQQMIDGTYQYNQN